MSKLISAIVGTIITLSSAVSAHAQQAPAYNAGWQPVVVTDQPVVVSTGTATTGGTYNSGWIQNGQVMLNPNNGQYVQNGQVYQPQQTANINYRTSGCQNSLGNALACMGMQGLTQVLVNRSAVREQAAATIQVQRAQFTLQNGGGQPVYSAAPPAPAGGICRLTMPDGRSQDIRVQTPQECQQAIAQAGGVMRQ